MIRLSATLWVAALGLGPRDLRFVNAKPEDVDGGCTCRR